MFIEQSRAPLMLHLDRASFSAERLDLNPVETPASEVAFETAIAPQVFTHSPSGRAGAGVDGLVEAPAAPGIGAHP